MKKLVVKQDPENEVPFEVMATAIEDISKAMKLLESSRASRRMIVALIKDNSGVPKSTIEIVLNNLEVLEKNYLKPKKVSK